MGMESPGTVQELPSALVGLTALPSALGQGLLGLLSACSSSQDLQLGGRPSISWDLPSEGPWGRQNAHLKMSRHKSLKPMSRLCVCCCFSRV